MVKFWFVAPKTYLHNGIHILFLLAWHIPLQARSRYIDVQNYPLLMAIWEYPKNPLTERYLVYITSILGFRIEKSRWFGNSRRGITLLRRETPAFAQQKWPCGTLYQYGLCKLAQRQAVLVRKNKSPGRAIKSDRAKVVMTAGCISRTH